MELGLNPRNFSVPPSSGRPVISFHLTVAAFISQRVAAKLFYKIKGKTVGSLSKYFCWELKTF